MPLGALSSCSANSSLCRNGSSTASRMASIWRAEAADHRVVDVRHLLQHQFLDVQLGDPLVREVHPAVDQQRVAGAQLIVAEPVREPDHALLVAVPDDQRAVTALEHLLEQHDLADVVELQHVDDVHRLVDHHLLARGERFDVDVGTDADAHLAPGGVDVGGVILLRLQEDAEAGRRLGEPVDFALQRHDLVARLAQRRGEPLVVGGGRAGVRPERRRADVRAWRCRADATRPARATA